MKGMNAFVEGKSSPMEMFPLGHFMVREEGVCVGGRENVPLV